MKVTINDPIIADSRITAKQVKEWYSQTYDQVVPTAVSDYLDEAERLCRLVHFDLAIIVGQSVHETSDPDTGKPWTSSWWRTRLNPAGIGITGDAVQNQQSQRWASGTTAAQGQVFHMAAYCGINVPFPDMYVLSMDYRNGAVHDAGFAGTVRTLGDLGAGKWATDPRYAAKIAERLNDIFRTIKEEPMSISGLTFGRVPHPAFEDHPITKAEGAGQNDLGPRTVKGVVWHRMIGSLRGTDGYFKSPSVKSLTDYGVGVLAQDGAADDGVIIRWNDPLGHQSGWASGTYSSAAYGDGRAFAEKYGINAINRDETSIEISGLTYNVPLSEKARQSIAAITAYWADQAEIPWTVFPITPADGFSFVRWHNEFGPDNGTKLCPGIVVMNETPALIERVRQIMRSYQVADIEVPKPPVYAASVLPAWWDDSLTRLHPSDAIEDGRRWWVQRRNFTAIKQTERRSRPDLKAKLSGPPVLADEKVWIERLLEADRDWLVTTDGHYLLASGFNPNVSLKSRKARAA